MPFISCLCQQRRSFPHSPRRTLVEADGQVNIEHRIIGAVDAGNLICGHRVVNTPLCHPRNQVFRRHTVGGNLTNIDSASQFAVQILQTGTIFSGVDIDFLSYQFRNVFQSFFPSSLYDYLPRNVFFTAINQAVFQRVGNNQVVGNQITFSFEQTTDQLLFIFHDLHLQIESQRLGKLLGQFVLESHGFTTIMEIRHGTVDSQHHQFLSFLNLWQIDGSLFRFFLRSARKKQKKGQHTAQPRYPAFHLSTIRSMYIFRISMAFSL